MNLEFVFKIIEEDEWRKAQKTGVYKGSSKDVEDGYIHFSEEQQIHETLKKFFVNKENLILLKVHTLKLDHLLWEQAPNGDMYPHLYSNLDIKNVVNYGKIKLINNKYDLPIFEK